MSVQGGGVGRLAGRPWRDVERVPLDELLAALGVEEAAPPGEALLTVWIAPGPWKPPVTLARRGVVLFVLSGALLRSRRDAVERRVDLLLAGDAIRMNGEDGALWRALPAQPVRLAVVGPHTVKALAGVPGAANALMHALLQQLELELELRAVVGIQRIEQRIVAFFALLARRLGERRPRRRPHPASRSSRNGSRRSSAPGTPRRRWPSAPCSPPACSSTTPPAGASTLLGPLPVTVG